MDEEKEKLIKQRFENLKGNLEVAHYCIKTAFEFLNDFDDFVELINNWENDKIPLISTKSE